MRQAELARRVNARPNTISALLTGKSLPQQSTLVAICWELGVWDSWVLYGPPNPKHIDAASKARGISVLQGHLPRKSAGTGLRQWLDNTAEGRRTTAEERDWLCGIAWPPERADAAYELAVRAYRALPSSTRK
jgi:transcriptional regulator with XRE-family HTH domain